MASSIYFSDPVKAGKLLVRKGQFYARQRRQPVALYTLVVLSVFIIALYWYWAQKLVESTGPLLSSSRSSSVESRFQGTSETQEDGQGGGGDSAAADGSGFSSDPLARAAQEALYEDVTGRKLRAPPVEDPVLERKRVIVLSTENGKINTGVWPGWGGGAREVTLNWAAAGVRVQKYCPSSCLITHDENHLTYADAVVMELVNHPKFGLDGQTVVFPTKDRPNPRPGAAAKQLPLLGLFYYEPASSFPAYTLASSDVATKFDFTMTPSQSTTLPVTLVCPWGRQVEDFLNLIPPKTPGRLLAYFSEHGNAASFTPFLDQLFTAAGADIHAYVHRRNLPLPDEAGGDPYQLSRRLDFMGTYRFVLITEGVEEIDFLTPEWSQVLVAGAIPVYLGAPNIADYAPGPRSFVNARDFATGGDLWNYLQGFGGGSGSGGKEVVVEAADDAYASFFAWKTGAFAAYQEDEQGLRYAVGTGQALTSTKWPKPVSEVVQDMTRWARPDPADAAAAEQALAEGATAEFKEASKWGWRLFRQKLDNCVHYAECRLCQHVHENT